MTTTTKSTTKFRIQSPLSTIKDDLLLTSYDYHSTTILSSPQDTLPKTSTTPIKQLISDTPPDKITPEFIPIAVPIHTHFKFQTILKVPKTGVMIVGIGGNNGTTLVAGLLANKYNLQYSTRLGLQSPNWYGSLIQSATMKLGSTLDGSEVYVPYKDVLPLVHPDDLYFTGWDLNSLPLGDAMKRAEVLDYDLQSKVYDQMQKMIPLPSIYESDFIAPNQMSRVNNTIEGTKQEKLDKIREDIRNFKIENGLDTIIILWSANTERYTEIQEGIHDTSKNLLEAVLKDESEISPSTIFALASILEGCPFINGSPQNTFVPGIIELALEKKSFIAGDDFKTGQTKIKSVLADFLISAGLKLSSIVSYNHLGNNDGLNLDSQACFRSKEISKAGVVEDMVSSNPILYPDGENIDHCIVIKYVPFVGDSKRAMDEYSSKIFMDGLNTIALHNTCEDSLLAAPLMLDLIVLTEFMTRVKYRIEEMEDYEGFHSVLSILSYLLKAPRVPEGSPVINGLFKQREAIDNLFRILVGLPPDNHLMLEHRITHQIRTDFSGICLKKEVLVCKVKEE